MMIGTFKTTADKRGTTPSYAYSWFIKLHFLLLLRFKSWMAAYFIFLFEFQVKDYLFSHFYVKQLFSAFTSLSKNKQIAHEKLRNTQKNPYCPELPKQKNSCSKMLLFDQLYKKLGYIPLDRSWWPEICQHPNSSDLRNCCCCLKFYIPSTLNSKH